VQPNGLRISRAAPIDRDDGRAEICFQNAHDLAAASGVGLHARVGLLASFKLSFRTRVGLAR
jgi:hypothetical protein